MRKKLIIILCVFCIATIQTNFINIFAGSEPRVGISRPTRSEVHNGESTEYYITIFDAKNVNITANDVGIAGKGVTLNKSIQKVSEKDGKQLYKVTLSNIQGPNEKLVSIAVRKGIATNDFGSNAQSYKSYGFRIKENVKPVPKPEPKPEPKPVPKPEVKPEPVPEVKPEPEPEPKPEPKPQLQKPTVKKEDTVFPKKEIKVNESIVDAVNKIIETNVKVQKPFVDKVSQGDIVKYIIEYGEGVKQISLTADKVVTNGFTANVKIREFGNKRVIYLTNIKGEIGKDKSISIKADEKNGMKEVANTPTFEIVEKKPINYNEMEEIPFTGVN